MINIIDNIEKLDAFRDEWCRLFEMDTYASPFQSFEYVKASIEFCKHERGTIHIICIKDDPSNQWIAIFPLFLNNSGILTYINYKHTDFCLPIVVPQYNNYNTYKELSEYILSNKEISGISWDNITENSQILSVLKPHFRYSIVHDINYYSSIDINKLPGDKDSIDSFRYVKAKQRKRLRKTFSKISDSCVLQICSISTGQSYPEKQISQLINKMVNDGIRKRGYFSDSMQNFWRQLYDNEY